MANGFFEFKQFRIEQDRSAMKVTTDACILGAYLPVHDPGKILDIGAGTGLLSLMLAQRTGCSIDAIENDAPSCLQAKENISRSPWHDRIRILHQDLKDFYSEEKYDLIMCNPPFFENHLQSPFSQKNQARHDVSLNSDELLDAVKRLLSHQGRFAVLLPFEKSIDFVRKAKLRELFAEKQLLIRHRPDKAFIRSIIIFKNSIPEKSETDILSIKNESGQYSQFFRRLLKDFYLHL